MQLWAIIPAAGQSLRLAKAGLGVRKQFLLWRGRPMFWHAAKALSVLPWLRGLVFIFPPEDLESAEEALAGPAGRELGLPWLAAPGGETRRDSVRHGLAALPPACTHVLVHDAARPFAGPELILRVAEALKKENVTAVIPGLELADTIKLTDGNGLVQCTLERGRLRAAQTPQGFRTAELKEAHRLAVEQGWQVTDDAELMDRCAIPVLVVPGEAKNVKLTTPEDLKLLRESSPAPRPCVGLGYDVHRYGGGRPFVLGGVRIPTEITLSAHSDGDVLAHALMDALLGCVGAGDIGEKFPDSNPAYAGINSCILLSEVLDLVWRKGLEITNADLTVVAQEPRIAPFREQIRKNLAKLLQLPEARVNIKATTEEHLGFTGQKQGVKALAAVSGLLRVADEPQDAPLGEESLKKSSD